MNHRFITLFSILMLAFCASATPIYGFNLANAAESNDTTNIDAKSGTKAQTGNTLNKPKKSAEAYFSEGLDCLNSSNFSCAKIAQASIPTGNIYGNLLAGNIAAGEKDFVTALRLLLPLQADDSLNPQAKASLHTSLALAYEDQDDAYRALEQRVLAEKSLSQPLAIKANEASIWQGLSVMPKAQLIEMRGNSDNTIIQGWIDLALAAAMGTKEAIANWQLAYPDHPAKLSIAQQLLDNQILLKQGGVRQASVEGKIAILLPFSDPLLYPVADAIYQGFSAANEIAGNSAELKIYPTSAQKEDILALYQQAINEGARYILGPLTRDEVNMLTGTELKVTTLTLNRPDNLSNKKNLYSFGLNVDDEITKIVKIARDSGMQSATIVMSGSNLSNKMAKAFSEAWTASGGNIGLPILANDPALLPIIKSQLDTNPTDMIFIAANAVEARTIRPALNTAIPTFGLSHLDDGLNQANDNAVLNGVRFSEIPWIIAHNSEAFTPFIQPAQDLPAGEMQRWFALGADAYHILAEIIQHPNSFRTFDGLTGKIAISATGEISRDLAMAHFSKTGIDPN